MPRILAKILLAHWAAAFTLMAGLCVVAAAARSGTALGRLGVSRGDGASASLSSPALCAALALAFGVCAALFAWSLLVSFVADPENSAELEDTVGLSLAVAIGALSTFLGFGVVEGFHGAFTLVASQLAALLATGMVIRVAARPVENSQRSRLPDFGGLAVAARTRSAQPARLLHFTGRTLRPESERH